jgi:hypothetical protein
MRRRRTAGVAIEALRSDAVTNVFFERFDINLSGRSTTITVRGRCQERHGRIHTDSVAKLVTAQLYLNDGWEAEGGRLRLLRRRDDLNDIIAEVPPVSGMLVAFRRSFCSFHGHEPFVGVSRYVMINWMASGSAAHTELLRHLNSASVKRTFVGSQTVKGRANVAELSCKPRLLRDCRIFVSTLDARRDAVGGPLCRD